MKNIKSVVNRAILPIAILLALFALLLISCNNRCVTGSTDSELQPPKIRKHCFNNLPEGIVVNTNDLGNNSRLHVRKFNSTETVVIPIPSDDYSLRLHTFIEGDTIIHCQD